MTTKKQAELQAHAEKQFAFMGRLNSKADAILEKDRAIKGAGEEPMDLGQAYAQAFSENLELRDEYDLLFTVQGMSALVAPSLDRAPALVTCPARRRRYPLHYDPVALLCRTVEKHPR